MQKFFDIKDMLENCPSVGKVKEPTYGGKSGKVLVYEVELDTNPIEFMAEISQHEYFKYIGVVFGKPSDKIFTVYVFKMVDDLFNYLLQKGAFDDFDGQLNKISELVEKVVECIKEESLVVNYNFYYNELTPEWFWQYVKENIIY